MRSRVASSRRRLKRGIIRHNVRHIVRRSYSESETIRLAVISQFRSIPMIEYTKRKRSGKRSLTSNKTCECRNRSDWSAAQALLFPSSLFTARNRNRGASLFALFIFLPSRSCFLFRAAQIFMSLVRPCNVSANQQAPAIKARGEGEEPHASRIRRRVIIEIFRVSTLREKK